MEHITAFHENDHDYHVDPVFHMIVGLSTFSRSMPLGGHQHEQQAKVINYGVDISIRVKLIACLSGLHTDPLPVAGWR